MFRFSKKRAESPRDEALRFELKARIERILELGADDVVTVSQIACFEPGCPDVETVILLMRVGQPTRALKLFGAMEDIADEELARLAVPDEAAGDE